ncbi:MAG: class I SAM-dependent methyltransferase [Thermoplasmata archaeon]|nr:class I SAM-dependent methyltransferase [Thermoplasmata archaeon]
MSDEDGIHDFEYGGVAREAVDWLASRGYLREGDCAMNVACGRGGFAGPMSRLVRVLVCMDKNPAALAEAGRRCAGGCRTELYQADWNTYEPSEGYDACLISPSYLCYSGEALVKMEAASRRSCIAVFPQVFDFRRLRKALLRSAGVPAEMQEFSDPRPFTIWLKDAGRQFESVEFAGTVTCPREVLRDAFVSVCVGRVPDQALLPLAERFADSISHDGTASYRFAAHVVAWDKG